MNVRIFGIDDHSTLVPLPDTSLSAAWEGRMRSIVGLILKLLSTAVLTAGYFYI